MIIVYVISAIQTSIVKYWLFMKKTIIFIVIYLSAINLSAQQTLKEARRKSWITYAYRISADTTESYIKKGIRSIDHYLQEIPALSFLSDSAKTDELPIGNYILISVNDTELVAEHLCITSIKPVILNNQVRPKIMIRDNSGTLYKNASVLVNDKRIDINEKTFTYDIQKKNPDGELLRIEVPGDTSFIRFTTEFHNYRTPYQQRLSRLRSTKAGRVITWLPMQVKYMIKNPPDRWFRKRYHSRRVQGGGFFIFNKPKYFPVDTIRFKAYVLNRKKKQYKKEISAFLSYSKNSAYLYKELTKLKPVSPGAYVYEFATGDTLPNDTYYSIFLRNKKGKQMLAGNFRIEDYLLDEVASYNLRSDTEEYFSGDSLQFSANAKDANGLGLMDGKVKLVLLAQSINRFHDNRVFIPDTLWQQEKELAIDNDTKFTIPSGLFPDADLTIRAIALFRNSNNEIQQKEITVTYISESSYINVKEENGYIKAEYIVNRKSVIHTGSMENDLLTKPLQIEFPYTAKIDPQVETYDFYTTGTDSKSKAYNSYDIKEDYRVTFRNIQTQDSVGFVLFNPYKATVYYSLFDKDKKTDEGSSSEEQIVWKGTIPLNKIYYLRWHYFWAGKENYGNESIAFLSKLLSTSVKSAETIYPGQTDTITVKVNDYKNKAAKKVNLTAVSYNTQFGKDVYVPEPPYIQKFSGKTPILYNRFETEETTASGKFILWKHQQWREKFHLDTMTYYRFLFPEKNYYTVKTPVQDVLPQVSVLAVSEGLPQEIYLLYINRQLVYYNGCTDKQAYAVSEMPGYVQIGMRLKDSYIEYDSIYLQPYYKHDIVFDINKPDSNKKTTSAEKFWSPFEKNLLNSRLLRIENNYRNNNAYVWQDNKSFYLYENKTHITGPFNNFDSIQFYRPDDFDFKFVFEPGYQYRISPQVVRLEMKQLFPEKEKIYLENKRTTWALGDTITALPEINYHATPSAPYLDYTNNNIYLNGYNKSRIKIEYPKDSSIVYTVLQDYEQENNYRIFWGTVSEINNIAKGNYSVVLVTNHFRFLYFPSIFINSAGTYCIKYKQPVYDSVNAVISNLLYKQEVKRKKELELRIKQTEEETKNKQLLKKPEMDMPPGTGMINGRVTDSKGKDGIPFTFISIKGYKQNTVADKDGNFVFGNLMPGQYTLVFSLVGYSTLELKVTVTDRSISNANAVMQVSNAALNEVVVIGYGTAKKRSFTASVATIKSEDLAFSLQGKAAGVSITSPGTSTSIHIRGAASVSGNTNPLYIVDGIPYDVMPDLSPDDITSTSVLKDAAAATLYGSRAANGAVIITTKSFNPKLIRDQFRDYAFWKPNLITDKKGEVKFTVTYPDNITSWETFVTGMDRKRRITKTSKITKSFKPFLAQLNTPQFLTEGDSVNLVGKKINYTTSDIHLKVEFTGNVNNQFTKEETVKANNASISEISIIAPSLTDSLHLQFSAKSITGFADGELRKIPVVKKGTTEAVGTFYVLSNDTTISYHADEKAADVTLHAQNNTIQLLLNEIEHLKKYPYFCMEQTASKLTGYAMEKKIRNELGEPFKNEKEMQKLKEKLQKNQLFEGGWSWWENGQPNLSITNYITRALLELKPDASLEPTLRNALLYIQNQLPNLNRFDLLESLYTLSMAGHDLDYEMYLKTIPFDSVSQHLQWKMVSVMQKQKINYDKELQVLMKQKTETMFGGLYWGKEGYWWDRNITATTISAFRFFNSSSNYESEKQKIIQYFLESRRNGYWNNTVESASILSTILPDMLKKNNDFTQPAAVTISGDTSFSITKFPYNLSSRDKLRNISVSKTGGGMMYFSAWQKIFNSNPSSVDSNFTIQTFFEKNNQTITKLKAGEKVKMQVIVYAQKDAEYVQLEIPVPAGCTYGNKATGLWYQHREYFKDRVLIFIEKMNKGKHQFEIELEPRYTGRFTLNPAKAELMYFPVFFGRNKMEQVEIEK